MHLYAASAQQFLEDASTGRLAQKLRIRFLHQHGHEPGRPELSSWQNSHRALSQALDRGGLLHVGVILEYQLPLSSKRLDALLVGKSPVDGSAQAVVVELKQWDVAELSDTQDCVSTYLNGRMQDKLHPSRQAAGYVEYLDDQVEAFQLGTV